MNQKGCKGKRILYVDNRTEYVVSHRLPLLKAARDRGFDVHVTTLTAGDSTAIEGEGITYHRIASGGRSSNPLKEVRLIVALVRLYRELQPDLLHHITLRSILYGGIASRFANGSAVINGATGLGYLFSSGSYTVRLARYMVLLITRLVTARTHHRFLFQNPDDKQLFVKWGIADEASSRVIKGSGVSTSRFFASPEQDGEPLVVFPARMLWHKGVEAFVEAARLVHQRGGSARFALVGDTDPDNPGTVSKRQLREWEEKGYVEWWGYEDNMPEVFAQSHIVCLPSAYREGVPKALIEAASSERPIVTTDMPGCREIVQHGENGFLVPVHDAEAVADALMRLVQQPDLRKRMGQVGRRLVEEEFSIEHVVKATLAVYEEVLSWPFGAPQKNGYAAEEGKNWLETKTAT